MDVCRNSSIRQVLRSIIDMEHPTRTALAQRLSLSQSGMTKIIAQLQAANLVYEYASIDSKRGRHPVELRVNTRIGAAVAVVAFAAVEPASVAWWRAATGALVLCAWRRPWRDGLSRRDLAASALFGVVLVAMNSSFYEAIARLPLGTAVSIEFVGPVAVAVLRGRGWAPRVAAVLALAGVACIGGLGLDLSQGRVRAGLAWILAAALAWALYIVLGQRVASTRSGVTNLALGCFFGAVLFAPVLGPGASVALTDSGLFAAVVGVGLLSTVVPYSLEALALTRLPAATFALFTALLPASSAVVGALMLRQVPAPAELAGLVLVSVAVWIASGKHHVAQRED